MEVLEVIEGKAWNVLGVASRIHAIPSCRLVASDQTSIVFGHPNLVLEASPVILLFS